MNPNDILAQQQALLNQAMQRSQEMMWGIIALYVALFFLSLFVLYMFYARLRDIADELRNLRIAYEFAQDRKSRAAGDAAKTPGDRSGDNPFATDDRFKPKPN